MDDEAHRPATGADRESRPSRRPGVRVACVVSRSVRTRQRFFRTVSDASNRRREPWVVEGMRWLHHPLRADASLIYIGPALDLLEEVKRTGDIFLPKRWLDALLGGHRAPEAALIVREFLATRPKITRWLSDAWCSHQPISCSVRRDRRCAAHETLIESDAHCWKVARADFRRASNVLCIVVVPTGEQDIARRDPARSSRVRRHKRCTDPPVIFRLFSFHYAMRFALPAVLLMPCSRSDASKRTRPPTRAIQSSVRPPVPALRRRPRTHDAHTPRRRRADSARLQPGHESALPVGLRALSWSGRADGNYRMTTYVQVMAAVRAGSASSTLVAVTQPAEACTATGAAATTRAGQGRRRCAPGSSPTTRRKTDDSPASLRSRTTSPCLRLMRRPRGAAPKDAPDITLTALSGKPLPDRRLEGNVVLLDFWASWCIPCRESFPEVDALHRELKPKGLDGRSPSTSTSSRRMPYAFLESYPHTHDASRSTRRACGAGVRPAGDAEHR